MHGYVKIDQCRVTSKREVKQIESSFSAINKEYNFHMNGVVMHDQLKTTYETDQESRFQYYVRVFFNLMDSVVANAHIIHKTNVNVRMNLFHFKVILADLLIKRFSSRKRKFTSKEPKLELEWPQTLKEPSHIVQFTDKRFPLRSEGQKLFQVVPYVLKTYITT